MKEKFYHIVDELLVKYLLGESTVDENIKVEQWIDADEINQKYYDDFKTIWEESKQFAQSSTIDEEASWQRFRNRIQAVPTQKAEVKSINTFPWIKIAAMIVIFAGAALLGYKIFGTKETKMLAVQSQNKVVTDTLPDRSIITLNKNSSISYPAKFNGGTRPITLQGEAFFKVTPNKSKPFIVHVNDVTVKVVGTSFNIKSINGNTEVIVETGIVQVIKNDNTVELHPEERILVKKDDSILAKENETGTLYNYYRTKEFECDNTPLWKLVEVLNQAYDVNIVIQRKELRNLPITTTFNNESLDNILEIIRQTFNISVAKTGSQIILK
ncbi:MAG: FecR family protein [Ginsengibacter sp.]